MAEKQTKKQFQEEITQQEFKDISTGVEKVKT